MLKKVLILLIVLVFASCSKDVDDFDTEKKALFDVREKNFSDLNGWENDEFTLFDKAIKKVCESILKSPNNLIKSNRLEYSSAEYKKHCTAIVKIDDKKELKKYIRNNFIPFEVCVNGSNEGKFTSYYEADLRASYNKDDIYKYPIYGKPRDLIEINLKDFDSKLPNQRLVGRVKNGKMIKYYTREEIANNDINAPVILWGDNPVDIFIMQIQGSAVANLPNGKKVRIAYADNNGHKFKGIGAILLEKGLIKPGEASMPKIRKWLNENEDLAKQNMMLNERFIFHKIVEAEGPIGAMGLPLYAGRSLAVDRSYIPLGSIMWLETTSPDGEDINKIVMAMDIGSAIQGGIRGDYFWGHGEDAFQYAGRMNSKGRYFILIPKGAEVKVND